MREATCVTHPRHLRRQLNGKLIFADLAGYERIKKSVGPAPVRPSFIPPPPVWQLTSGIRKDEATSINLSLTALGVVECRPAPSAACEHAVHFK